MDVGCQGGGSGAGGGGGWNTGGSGEGREKTRGGERSADRGGSARDNVRDRVSGRQACSQAGSPRSSEAAKEPARQQSGQPARQPFAFFSLRSPARSSRTEQEGPLCHSSFGCSDVGLPLGSLMIVARPAEIFRKTPIRGDHRFTARCHRYNEEVEEAVQTGKTGPTPPCRTR
jgi:hypothetical protein